MNLTFKNNLRASEEDQCEYLETIISSIAIMEKKRKQLEARIEAERLQIEKSIHQIVRKSIL